MASLKENIKQAISDFNNIESAIEECGVDVPYDTDTSEYGNMVRAVYEKGMLDGKIKISTKTHEKWLEINPVLDENEIAIISVQTVQDGVVNYIPSTLIKLGNGKAKYSELDFTYSKASDVYEWAKKANLAYGDLPSALTKKIDTLESERIEAITNIELEELLK